MQDENIKNGTDIPENAFRELKDGEEYVPVMRPDKKLSGSHPLLCVNGTADGSHLQCGRSLPRSESRTSL